jgi:hypothetical protein
VVHPKPYVLTSEKQLLVPGCNSNNIDQLKSLSQIVDSSNDGDLFILQKGVVSIFRFEDVVFSLFNHLSIHKRRGQSGRDVFMQMDPFNKV